MGQDDAKESTREEMEAGRKGMGGTGEPNSPVAKIRHPVSFLVLHHHDHHHCKAKKTSLSQKIPTTINGLHAEKDLERISPSHNAIPPSALLTPCHAG